MDDSPVDMSQDLYRPLATPPPLPLAVVYEPVIEKPPRVSTGFTAFGVYFLTTLIAGVVVAVGLVISQGALRSPPRRCRRSRFSTVSSSVSAG